MTSTRVKNIVISGTNMWNPGDDFVRDGVIKILRELFAGFQLNFLFYNFNQDFFPQSKFSGISNMTSKGDLEKYRDSIDAIVIAGLSAGTEIKDLYNWVIQNKLQDRVYLIGAGYENTYVERYISEEPEATIFKNARIIIGRTRKTPRFIPELHLPYHHINCPAILSVPSVKHVSMHKKISRIGFSIQLPHRQGISNHSCSKNMYDLGLQILFLLNKRFEVEVIAHHKSEYFHFINLLKEHDIPVIFSSFYHDLFDIYPRYDLLICTRLHSSLFANGFGIPGIIINDTDRHTHCLEGFPHSVWVNSLNVFKEEFNKINQSSLQRIAEEADSFKEDLFKKYLDVLREPFGISSSVEYNDMLKPRTVKSSVSSLRLRTSTLPENDVKENGTTNRATPVHFFTIVLNGEPFIRHHIEIFSQLPFKWQWHIIEGVADLKHDTAWSVQFGGRITDELHHNGLSNDGTTEYLDELANKFSENITIYRKPDGKFWDGKLEMVNAPLVNINEECLLWQVDVDEYWSLEQIGTVCKMFAEQPEKSVAYYLCNYFVGPELIITTRNTYGNHTDYEWLRTWRYNPGDRWIAHEPPRLCRKEKNDKWVDLAMIDPFLHHETEKNNLIFNHQAYVTEQQLRFKEIYYGYSGAVNSWRSLQAADNFPVYLRDYFPWVKDDTIVDHAGVKAKASLAKKNILWIRPDSIGDNILASSMLQHIHDYYKNANIMVLCQEHIAELYNAFPYITEIIAFNRKKAETDKKYRNDIIEMLRKLNVDILLNSVYSRDLLTDFLAINSGARETVALQGDSSNMPEDVRHKNNALYSNLITSNDIYKGEIERHKDFLKGIHIIAEKLEPDIWITPEYDNFAADFFNKNNLDPDKTIALFAGAQQNFKDFDGYGHVLSKICREYGFSIISMGDSVSSEINGKNLDDISVYTINICGKTNLLQAASILSRCRLAVGADTGLAHMACAVGVQNVILLGGGHFGRFMPYSPLTSIVCLPLDCYYCNWKCRYDKAHCIKDIHFEVIAGAIKETLEKISEKPRIFVQGHSLWEQNTGYPKWQSFHNYLNVSDVDIVPVGEIKPDTLQLWDTLKPMDKTAQTNFLEEMSLELIRTGENLFSDNDLEGAETSFLRALELDNNSPDVLNNLGVINLNKENQEKALEYFESAVKIQPDNVMFLKNLADFYLNDPSKYENAINTYSRILEIDPDDIDTLLCLGRISSSLKEYESAKNFFNKIITIDPGNQDVIEALALLQEVDDQASPPFEERITNNKDFAALKFSVITPSYNQVLYIDQTIQSVLAQNYKNIEHIVMDGGSTDGTIEILKKYPHLIWRSEKDNGQSDVLNKALHMATGDIIAWINSDDWYEPNIFPVIAIWFNENPDKNIIMGDCNLIDENGKVFNKIINTARGFNELKQYWVSQSIPTQPAIFFRKKLLDEFGYPDINLHYAMDYDLWMKFSQKNYFHHLDLTVANYRFHSSAKGGDQDWSKFVPEWKEVSYRYSHGSNNIPIVSVIIPCFNYGNYLKEAVESVINQTYQNLEIIIINDGSTDNTKDIAEGLISEYSSFNIKLIDQKNSGQPAISRNNGIASAKGEFILCLDADDCLTPTMIEECLQVLKSNRKISIAYTDRQDFDGSDQIVLAGDYDFAKLKYANHISYCALYKKKIWDRIHGYRTNVKGLEDWDFWIAAGARGYIGKRIPKPLFCYRRHDTGLFQEAKSNFRHKFAQIVLNNREVYSNSDVSRARYTLENKDKDSKANYPLVSVIVPTFNRPGMLKDAIKSVLNQTFQNLEIIVVNDSGEDVSGIIRSFNDDRIKLIQHTFNKGLAGARNTGIMAARGKYIAYLDDDDIYYPDHLEILANTLEDGEYEVAYTDAYRAHQVYKNGVYEITNRDIPYSIDFSKDRLLYQNISPVNCFMHTKRCLDGIGLFDEDFHAHEDWEMWIRLSRKYDFKHIKKVTTEFRWRTDGSTMSSNRRREFLRTMEEIFKRYKSHAQGKPEVIQKQDKYLRQLKRQVDRREWSLKCSIIIPVYNQVKYTRTCLEALIENTLDSLYEVIIIDNASTDGTKDFFATLEGDVKIITNNENLGFAKSCNQGAQAASGEYLVFLNNDTVPHKNWLTELIDVADAWRDVGIVGSKLLFPDNTIQHAGVAMLPVLSHMYPKMPSDFLPANKPRDLNVITAACMLIRRDIFFSVGCFHEGYINGCEDIDLCLSVRDAGKRVFYNPRSVITHFEGQTPGREDRMDDNRKFLFERWGDKMPSDYEKYLLDDGFRKSRTDETKWDYHEDLCKKTVSIIIVTYNSLNDIKRCLSSIQAETNLPYEAIIIDNNSTDGTKDYLKRLKGFHVIINDENIGFSKACNQGILAANGEYIVLLNPDTAVTSDWAWRMMLHFRDGVGAVGPVSNYVAGIQKYELYMKTDLGKVDNNEVSNRFYEWNKNRSIETKLLIGFCIMIKRSVMDDIGLLDEDFFLGIEDLEYSWRLRQKGYKLIVATDVFIFHHGQKSFSTVLPEKTRRITQKCQNKLYSKLESFYGKGKVPSSQELWGMDWFKPSQITKPQLTSIIILCFNQLEYTKKCLQSIVKYTSVPYELILVDNGSTDGTVPFLEDYANKHDNCKIILNNENRGFAGGNNQGIAAAEGDYILLLNNDVIVTQDWLERLIAHIESDENIGMAGPVSNSVSGPQQVKRVTYDQNMNKMQKFSRNYSNNNVGRTQEILRLVGFCLLIKRQVLDTIGGLDENYGNGNYEDDDLCLRSRIAGFRNIIAHDVFIHHYGSMTFKGNKIDYTDSLEGNRQRFADKWKDIIEVNGNEYRLRMKKKDQVKKLLEWGEERFSQGNFKAAVKIFERVLKLDKVNSQAMNNLGVIQWKISREPASAMKTFQAALTLNPKDSDALENLVQAATESSRFDLINPALLNTVKKAQPANPDLVALFSAQQNSAMTP